MYSSQRETTCKQNRQTVQFHQARIALYQEKKTGKGRVDEIPDTSKNIPQFRMCKKHRHEHPDSPGKKRKQNLNLPRCFVILQQVFRLAEATVMILFVWFVYFLTFQFVTFVLKQY